MISAIGCIIVGGDSAMEGGGHVCSIEGNDVTQYARDTPRHQRGPASFFGQQSILIIARRSKRN